MVRDPNRQASHIVTDIAQEWVTRSGRLPRSIRISSTFYNESVIALVDIINQYSDRWSDLDLNIPDYSYELFHATDNHAPILKSIRFHCQDDLDFITSYLEFQLTCPQLERASLLTYQWIESVSNGTILHISLYNLCLSSTLLLFCAILPD